MKSIGTLLMCGEEARGWQTLSTLSIALCVCFCACAFPFFSPSAVAATAPRIHGAPLEDAIDFYQFSDDAGGVHFVDNPSKIPARYRSRAIVRRETPSARQTTRVVIDNRSIHVPVLFRNGTKTEQAIMLLDTGASTTSISEELAGRLGIDLASMPKSTTRLADGSSIDIHLATVDSVSIGFQVKSPLEVFVFHHLGNREQHDGFLGLDFLRDIQYQIDMENGLIRWQ